MQSRPGSCSSCHALGRSLDNGSHGSDMVWGEGHRCGFVPGYIAWALGHAEQLRCGAQAGLDRAQQRELLKSLLDCWAELPGELDLRAMQCLERFMQGHAGFRPALASRSSRTSQPFAGRSHQFGQLATLHNVHADLPAAVQYRAAFKVMQRNGLSRWGGPDP